MNAKKNKVDPQDAAVIRWNDFIRGGKTVDLPAPAELIGQIVPVRITKAQTFSLYGELLCTR